MLSGDAPLIRSQTIRRMRDFHIERNAAMTILTAKPADPTGYGRVLREGSTDRVAAIVEQKSLRPEQSNVGEINSGFYAFKSEPLFANIDLLTTDNPHGEYYLTDMASLLVAEGQTVMAIRAEDPAEVLGANTIAELVSLDANLRMRKARELMSEGVTVLSPGNFADRRGGQRSEATPSLSRSFNYSAIPALEKIAASVPTSLSATAEIGGQCE